MSQNMEMMSLIAQRIRGYVPPDQEQANEFKEKLEAFKKVLGDLLDSSETKAFGTYYNLCYILNQLCSIKLGDFPSASHSDLYRNTPKLKRGRFEVALTQLVQARLIIEIPIKGKLRYRLNWFQPL